MNNLTARERKIVAIGILVALIALIWFALISPILSGFAERTAERERLSGQLIDF